MRTASLVTAEQAVFSSRATILGGKVAHLASDVARLEALRAQLTEEQERLAKDLLSLREHLTEQERTCAEAEARQQRAQAEVQRLQCAREKVEQEAEVERARLGDMEEHVRETAAEVRAEAARGNEADLVRTLVQREAQKCLAALDALWLRRRLMQNEIQAAYRWNDKVTAWLDLQLIEFGVTDEDARGLGGRRASDGGSTTTTPAAAAAAAAAGDQGQGPGKGQGGDKPARPASYHHAHTITDSHGAHAMRPRSASEVMTSSSSTSSTSSTSTAAGTTTKSKSGGKKKKSSFSFMSLIFGNSTDDEDSDDNSISSSSSQPTTAPAKSSFFSWGSSSSSSSKPAAPPPAPPLPVVPEVPLTCSANVDMISGHAPVFNLSFLLFLIHLAIFNMHVELYSGFGRADADQLPAVV